MATQANQEIDTTEPHSVQGFLLGVFPFFASLAILGALLAPMVLRSRGDEVARLTSPDASVGVMAPGSTSEPISGGVGAYALFIVGDDGTASGLRDAFVAADALRGPGDALLADFGFVVLKDDGAVEEFRSLLAESSDGLSGVGRDVVLIDARES